MANKCIKSSINISCGSYFIFICFRASFFMSILPSHAVSFFKRSFLFQESSFVAKEDSYFSTIVFLSLKINFVLYIED